VLKITGTLIWYYYICPREVWLMARELNPDEDNYFLEIGRFLSEETYRREKKEIEIGNIKIDLLKKDDKKIVIGEVKKSSKFESSAKMQLAFYLYRLKQNGIEAKGGKIISSETPPEPKKIRFCTKCAYREFCWA